ncbi:replication restart helicase PriA [Treponema brennaborense]|uniref:Replication restart protein PriA n=1 Tax=Treponema brennaborense (strain DSM 12168 / CIP 105900 / DD5/3) TaxID=906968 RepID=F4LL01_TREBD|nr:primosomal protein N' [Treponema brennaborense]AEE16598.1 primosomal protein N' [Treponema brennaborense DSM 12168]
MIRYVETVLNVPLPQSFTYLADGDTAEAVRPGMRAEVRFGSRRMTAFIVSVADVPPAHLAVPAEKLKYLTRLLDAEPVFTAEHIALSAWIARYYLCTQGEAISAMIPSGKRETDSPGFSFTDDAIEFEARTLSEEQKRAAEGIFAPGSKLHYVYGPTGTGKTEVFLQAAQKMLDEGKGVIYLVPEIGLTHQVREAVVRRFGHTAAVLHSELTPSQRLKQWKRILEKDARVVIGARSAVFAPVPDLGLIIIDEEHDGSYKSGTTPRYHARQVAMHRCAEHGIPLVMGSATPSVEAWHLMQTGAIARHTLTQRLAGGAQPEIEVVNLSEAGTADGCLSERLCAEIRRTLDEKRQTILFLNRRGFTHFFRCNTCGYELTCKNCSVALTYHKHEKRLRCHYCGWLVEPPSLCPECGSVDVGYSGFGTEFIEAETKAKFPQARVSRIDTDSLTKKGELQEKLAEFRNGEVDILLGTQMVAKGLNFPNLKLVGVVLADTGLHMPDFRAAERTFALITQVAGRAGRFFPDGKVIVQSFSPDRDAIARACKGDAAGFYAQELSQRQLLGFPPFCRMIRLVFRSAISETAQHAAEGAAVILAEEVRKLNGTRLEASREPAHRTDGVQADATQIEILGPSECPLAMIAANYRWQVLLRGPSVSALQSVCARFIYGYKAPLHVYIEADVDPVSLL